MRCQNWPNLGGWGECSSYQGVAQARVLRQQGGEAQLGSARGDGLGGTWTTSEPGGAPKQLSCRGVMKSGTLKVIPERVEIRSVRGRMKGWREAAIRITEARDHGGSNEDGGSGQMRSQGSLGEDPRSLPGATQRPVMDTQAVH